MKKVIVSMLATLFLVSCNSTNATECEELKARISKACEDTTWLEQEIELLKSLDTTARLTQYTYQDNPVFMVEICLDCVDAMTDVYSCGGEVICRFGGIAGINTCPGFSDTATDKKIIWHN